MIEPRTSEYRDLFDAAARIAGLRAWSYRGHDFLPGCWLEGLALAESGGRPMARRYEPHQDRASRRDAPSDGDVPDRDDGDLEDDASYGLMQVLGWNARKYVGAREGTPLHFGWLYRPIANVACGLWVLGGELRAVYVEHPHQPESDRISRALARYNGGVTGDALVDGDIRLRRYVDRVAEHAAKVQESRVRMGWRSA